MYMYNIRIQLVQQPIQFQNRKWRVTTFLSSQFKYPDCRIYLFEQEIQINMIYNDKTYSLGFGLLVQYIYEHSLCSAYTKTEYAMYYFHTLLFVVIE